MLAGTKVFQITNIIDVLLKVHLRGKFICVIY